MPLAQIQFLLLIFGVGQLPLCSTLPVSIHFSCHARVVDRAKNLPFDALRVKQSDSFSPCGTWLHRPVSSVVKRTPSVREVLGSILGPVKSAQCRQRLATVVKFLRFQTTPPSLMMIS